MASRTTASTAEDPLWLTEAEVASLVSLPEAIAAVERWLALEASAGAQTMEKTHVVWGEGHSLHALGGEAASAGFVGTKTWAHTAGGATPLLILWDSGSGRLKAVIEAFVLGQLRTGAVSGVATRWLARSDAAELALIGTGKQALPQVAAVAAVRPLSRVRVFSPTAERRAAFVARLAASGFAFRVTEARSVFEAVEGCPIITTATRAREPLLAGRRRQPFGGPPARRRARRRDRDHAAVPYRGRAAQPAARGGRHPLQGDGHRSRRRRGRGRGARPRGRTRHRPPPSAPGAGSAPAARRIVMAKPFFQDVSGQTAPEPELWEPVIFTQEEIDAEAERLASLPRPANGRRESLFVHPRSTEPGLGLLPGIRVTLSVLRPGERTEPVRRNSTEVEFCIRGGGSAVVGRKRIAFSQYDVWNHPSWHAAWQVNDADELQVRLTYSNAPLLEKMNVHLVEESPREDAIAAGAEPSPGDAPRRGASGAVPLAGEGAMLMPYETLINPPPVDSRALHWPWRSVKAHLDQLDALGADYGGRRLYLLYNPATGRTNGTTPSFFATITVRPPGIVDRPHRHVSAAINYYFRGRGWSVVDRRRYEWKAGDLMLSAPGWAVHHHASSDDDAVYELTVQDQPLNIAMESLLWQEDLTRPPRVLGAEAGFATNRSQVE